MFTDVLGMLAPQAQRKGVAVALETQLPDSLEVLADRGRLRQVLLNLLSNAIKFTDAGAITVSATVTDVAAEAAHLRCEVTDTGVGIPADSASRLFQDFSQLDPSDTRRFGGTGLGLAISARLLALMGGSIGYLPSPAGGSVFWFTASLALPSHSDMAPRRRPGSGSASALDAEGPAILIVEDNEINALILTKMLEHLGYSSRTAASGAEGLAALDESTFQAVLMDCQMPVQDGFATTAAIRQLPNGQASVPIIAITATATTEDQQRCLAAGMNDYLPKPIVMERLQSVVSRWAPQPD
jgi:CheY-like chemotaxis protein